MSGIKPLIGLKWEPKLPGLSIDSGSNKKSYDQGQSNALWKASTELVGGLYVQPHDSRKVNKILRKQVEDTAGSSWFDMPAPTMTPELKKDLHLLKLRSAIDPKRHYKKGNSNAKTLPKHFQVGTVVESATEFYSGRLVKKEIKTTLANELLTDPKVGQFRKRKVREIEEKHRPTDNVRWKIKGKETLRRAKQIRH